MSKFVEKYGPWCVITGASSGMGLCYAEQLACKGLNLVIVARRKALLDDLASYITNKHNIIIKVVVADLTTTKGIHKLNEVTEEIDVGLLINNAGREDSGSFFDIPLEDAILTLKLNCLAPLQLTHHYAHKMKERNKGGIIFISSLVSYQGVPFVSNYAGTKSYNLIFGESVAEELKDYNIDVLISTPGFTKTELAKDWNFSTLPINPLSPSFVAKKTILSLGRKRLVIPGGINKFLYFSSKYLQPRWLNTFLFKFVFTRVLRKKMHAC